MAPTGMSGRTSPSSLPPAGRRHAAALLAVALAAWAFVAWLALVADPMTQPLARLAMPMSTAWRPATVAAVFMMWSVMMAAMMLPSALPMALVFARLSPRGGRAPFLAFVGAYLLVWAGFSVVATLLHWALQSAGLVSPMSMRAVPVLSGGLLVAAGLYQMTPLKNACLSRCRAPVQFLMSEWRAGTWGALVMGLRHGLFCVGCCWALMAVLFAVGIMNLPAVVALALAVGIEKLVPRGDWIARGIGIVLILAGLFVLGSPPAGGPSGDAPSMDHQGM